jgi:hypothetical protein
MTDRARSLAGKFFLWILALAVLTAAWFILLANVAPASLEFASVGTVVVASSPPALLALVAWTALRWTSSPQTEQPAAMTSQAQATTLAPPKPAIRFRVGAWSALTPFGNGVATIEGAKARTSVFKPDKAMLLPSGLPAHSSQINTLDLEALGHAPGSRLRAPRVTAMLISILDELHAQQVTLTESVDSPVNVYWLVPQGLMPEDEPSRAMFDLAWARSAWSTIPNRLHMMTVTDQSAFALQTNLQNDMDHSAMPYALMLAADSLINGEAMAPALALGHIFSTESPQGFIPSEGAGGILLFNPSAAPEDLWSNAPIMMPVTDHTSASDAMAAAVAASGAGADRIGLVVSDTDHRIKASMQVVGAMTQLLPGLDPLAQRISPMEFTGIFGAATGLVHMVIAVEMAGESSVLAISTNSNQIGSVVIAPS